MSTIEQIAMLGNSRENNKVFTLNSGESVICYFEASGSDTATAKYYDLKGDAKRVAISTTKAASITHINGHELDFPKSIPTGGLTFTVGIRWDKITIRADQDATSIEVYAY